ncbi:hypothetical protein [Spiroplasma endosymbiont of Labia minor]|uniref:hypothetical protein n=1 Tax=Spiroplasma endosymbiont of Labia minor TaxID=3066305 RepID=UPI0030CCC6CD
MENKTLDGAACSIFQFFDNTILVETYVGSIYKLTDEGKIDTSVGYRTGKLENKTLDGYVYSIAQLANGIILAGVSSNSIYKLVN